MGIDGAWSAAPSEQSKCLEGTLAGHPTHSVGWNEWDVIRVGGAYLGSEKEAGRDQSMSVVRDSSISLIRTERMSGVPGEKCTALPARPGCQVSVTARHRNFHKAPQSGPGVNQLAQSSSSNNDLGISVSAQGRARDICVASLASGIFRSNTAWWLECA